MRFLIIAKLGVGELPADVARAILVTPHDRIPHVG